VAGGAVCGAFRAARIPIRTLAVAADNGLLAPELAAGHRARQERDVDRRQVRQLVHPPGRRQALLNAPDITTTKGCATVPSSPCCSAVADSRRRRRSPYTAREYAASSPYQHCNAIVATLPAGRAVSVELRLDAQPVSPKRRAAGIFSAYIPKNSGWFCLISLTTMYLWVSSDWTVNFLGDAPRILIVDDEPAVRALFDRVLAQDGYHLTLVGTAREALMAIQNTTFDLAVVDLSLPDEDGTVLVRQIRFIAPDVKILAISGFMAEFMPVVLIAAGATAPSAKPMTPRTLRAAVYRALDPSAAWSAK
jgi:CheY-like chemotaxis protein